MKRTRLIYWTGLCLFALFLLALSPLALVTGCTVVPEPVHAIQPSFDGNIQNSGFLGYDADGSGRLTVHGRDRYNALIATYGKLFAPALRPDDGLTLVLAGDAVAFWRIDAEHLVKFGQMNGWRKSGRPAP